LALYNSFVLLGANRRRLFVQLQHPFNQTNYPVISGTFRGVVKVYSADGNILYLRFFDLWK